MANSQLITTKFRNSNAKEFVDSVAHSNTTYYVFAGKATPFPNSDDYTSVNLIDNEKTSVEAYREMLFGKKVANTDVAILATRYDWVANTVYSPYSDDVDLFNLKYYTVVNESNTYHVYKCLDNNGGAPSTQQPTFSDTAANDVYYSTSDGYQWKYMSTITAALFNKFADPLHIPLIVNANVAGNAVSGAIDTIKVDNGGANYNNYLSGIFNAGDIRVGGLDTVYNVNSTGSTVNNYYTSSILIITGGTGQGQYREITSYNVIGLDKQVTINSAFSTLLDSTSQYEISPMVKIIGDGQQTANAEARAIINAVSSNSVDHVEILTRGRGYFYATASIQNSPMVNQFVEAQISPVIGPSGGHGSDLYSELNGRYAGVSIVFANNENDTITSDGDYREIGLLKNPLYRNVSLTINNTDGQLGSNGTFIIGETVVQDDTGATGTISSMSAGNLILDNFLGSVVAGNTTHAVLRGKTSAAYAVVTFVNVNGTAKDFSTFDGTYRYITSSVSGTFEPGEQILTTNSSASNSSLANAVFYSQNSSGGFVTLKTTEQFGVFNVGDTLVGSNSGASMVISTKYSPDLKFNSGKLLYLENFATITRSDTTTEQFNLVLDF